jgi:hypothetical protein
MTGAPDMVWAVTAIPPVRFRAGRKFTAVPVLLAPGTLTEAEVAAIQGDPMLRVEQAEADEADEVEAAPAPEPEPAAKAAPAPKPAAKPKAQAKPKTGAAK